MAAMRLMLVLPTGVLLDRAVAKVIAEADDGHFCLLPRHIDFVAPLVPGVLSFTEADGTESFVGIDEGTLIKCGQEVRVVCPNAVRSGELGELRRLVAERFEARDAREQAARGALARLESGLARRFVELEELGD